MNVISYSSFAFSSDPHFYVHSEDALFHVQVALITKNTYDFAIRVSLLSSESLLSRRSWVLCNCTSKDDFSYSCFKFPLLVDNVLHGS